MAFYLPMLMRVFARSMRESGHARVARRRLAAACVIALIGFAACRGFEEHASDRRGPLCEGCNVILISMDTLRADHVGAYGYPRPVTPAIDRVASGGVLFEDAIGQSAWTRPAHFSMFTGLYPIEHGVVDMAGRSRLPDGTPTLASGLRAAGWRTGAFTAGANVAAHFGFDDGFEVYETHGKRMLDHLDAVRAWIDAVKDQRFFLFFHGLDAHRPYHSDAVDRRALGVAESERPAWRHLCNGQGRTRPDPSPLIDAYDAAAHRGDRAVGRLLETLDAAGLSDRTVVIVTSDHGEGLLDHGDCFHIRELHGEIVRVPLIVRVPGLSVRRVTGVVPASVAIAPTILDLVGASRSGIGGPSLAGILGGERPGFGHVVSETASRYRHGSRSGHVRAVTTDREKLIHWIDAELTEYHDLERDRRERSPVADTARTAVLAGILADFVGDHAPLERDGEKTAPLPRKLHRELRRLGYMD